MTLASVLNEYPLGQLGSSSGIYLSYNDERQEWSVVRLRNCVGRIFRWMGISHRSTTLRFIADRIRCEDEAEPYVLNRIHELWQRKYPLMRNPLKLAPFTLIDPCKADIAGNIKPEILQVGRTYISIMQAEKSAPLNHLVLPLYEVDEEELKMQMRGKLYSIKEHIREVTFTLGHFVRPDIFIISIRIALEVIEKFVFDHQDRFHDINILFTNQHVDYFVTAINVCRQIGHPHAQFVELAPEPV